MGDRCVRYTGQLGGLEEVIVLGEDDKGIKILNYMDKEVYTQGHKLFDFSAFERQIRSETFLNSVKALDVKPNSTVVASIIPNQISYTEATKMFDGLKAMFPNNDVSMVMGVDVTVEAKNGGEQNEEED